MRYVLLKAVFSSALVIAAATHPSAAASRDFGGSMQLAQASGGPNRSSSGAGTTTGATTGAGQPAVKRQTGTARPLIPPSAPMRDPITPRVPPQPGQPR